MSRKKKLNKKGRTLLIILFIALFAIGITIFTNTTKNDSKNKNSNSKDESKEEPKKEEKKLQIIDLNSNSRNYAVMINNIKTVWGYQSGIQDAYIVYEIIVEGGYTRLMAIFKDKSLDRIGSVRSSRHYFLDYALENDAIYVHFGWSPQAESDMKTLGVNNINFMSYNGYERDRSLGLATEHTAFTSTDKIMNGISYYGYRNTADQKPLLNYSVDSVNLSNIDGAIVANKIDIIYSNNRSTQFEYDSANKVYNRFQNNIEHKDYVTGKQYTAKNIIAYQVNNYTISGDGKGRQTIDNIGKGTGWYISEGYAIPITWEKNSRSSKTIYRYNDGTEIKVNDGNTYIQISPKNQQITIE